jgi:hypothetical protein
MVIKKSYSLWIREIREVVQSERANNGNDTEAGNPDQKYARVSGQQPRVPEINTVALFYPNCLIFETINFQIHHSSRKN